MDNSRDGNMMLDLETSRLFLEVLYGLGLGRIHVCSTDDWAGRTFDLDNDLYAYIAELDKAGAQGIYCRATTLKGDLSGRRRGSETDSRELVGLWADIDISGVGHKTAKTLPPDVNEAMRIVNEAGLPEPTVWIHSGGGLYPWWILDKPMDIVEQDNLDLAKGLIQGLQKVLAHWAQRLGYHYGTEVGDMARVLRIPGTVNRKEGLERPCRILAWGERSYTVEELTRIVSEALAEIPEPEQPFTRSVIPADDFGARPGDDFNARASFQSILIPHGWTWLYQRGGTWYLRRPGKRDGISATIGHSTDGVERLYVFTSSTEFEPNVPYTKFAAWALLEHHGDYRAAASALRKEGFGADRVAPSRSAASTDVALRSGPAVAVASAEGEEGPGLVIRQPGQQWMSPRIDPDTIRWMPQTEVGMSELFADTMSGSFRFVNGEYWTFWNGSCWQEDNRSGGRAVNAMTGLSNLVRDVAKTEPEGPFATFAKKIQTGGKIKSALSLASANPAIMADDRDFDQHPEYVTATNGTLNLKTGELGPHNPNLMLTRRLGVAYDPNATAPRWEQFMREVIPDPQIRDYVQRAIGYTLLGEADQRALFFIHGRSGTGKSQFLNAIMRVFGDFGVTASRDTFRRKDANNGPTPQLHALRGSRLASLSELDADERFDQALLKQVTGTENVKTRALYQGEQEWRPQFVGWIATNHLPRLDSEDDAIWRRVKPVPFTQQFLDEDVQEFDLGRKMADAEGSGILNWILAGVAMYQEHGLKEPAALSAGVQEYRLEVDTVAQFVAEAVEDNTLLTGEEMMIGYRQLYAVYSSWAQRNNVRPLGERRFGHRVESLGRFEKRRSDSGMVWRGLSSGANGMLGSMESVRYRS